MLSKIRTVALNGMQGMEIEIQTDLSPGLPYFEITGMGDTAVREAAGRVKRAIANSGFEYPRHKITVNLAPAYVKKSGSHFDLGIAVGLLKASGALKGKTDDTIFIGELSFDGKVLPARGVLPMITAVSAVLGIAGAKEIVIPEANCPEAYLFTADTGMEIIPAVSLMQIVQHIGGKKTRPYEGDRKQHQGAARQQEEGSIREDFKDIKGCLIGKEAIMAALAGGHNMLMIGPPGSGKTMMAKCGAGILPPMSLKEKIQTTSIYSYAGKLQENMPFIENRPFRHVGPGISRSALIGGGTTPMPGEISLAHNGVLFLDEMLQIPSNILEAMREPMEEKEICISRGRNRVVFPADFVMIGASNPCPCGYLGDRSRQCTCSSGQIARYRAKLSGAMADRIDICVEITRIGYGSLKDTGGLSSEQMKKTVTDVRYMQMEKRGMLNGQMKPADIEKYCILTEEAEKLLKRIYEYEGISIRRYHKLLKVARTIADIRGEQKIGAGHLTAAHQYVRLLEQKTWGNNYAHP